MTAHKADLPLPARTPAYVDRELGAAELRISPTTWDEWVAEGRLPPPAPGFPPGMPRWRWADVDHKLAVAREFDSNAAFLRGAAVFGPKNGKRREIA